MMESIFNNNLIHQKFRIHMESKSEYEDNEFEDDFDDDLDDSVED